MYFLIIRSCITPSKRVEWRILTSNGIEGNLERLWSLHVPPKVRSLEEAMPSL